MSSTWKRFRQHHGWRVTDAGPIEVEGEGAPTSRGVPTTLMALLREHGAEIKKACTLFDIPVPWLAGMIPIEAARLKRNPRNMSWHEARERGYIRDHDGRGHEKAGMSESRVERQNSMRFDPISLRLEPGYVSPYDTPGRISSGLGQCLFSTMHAEAVKRGMTLALNLGPCGPAIELSFCPGDLMDPLRACLFAAAYMDTLKKKYKDGVDRDGDEFDFVYLVAAYNAGGVYESSSSRFGMQTYSPTRTDRAIEWHNDCYRDEVAELWRD